MGNTRLRIIVLYLLAPLDLFELAVRVLSRLYAIVSVYVSALGSHGSIGGSPMPVVTVAVFDYSGAWEYTLNSR